MQLIVVILRRIQENYLAKEKKLCMCFVDLEEVFDRVPRKVMAWKSERREFKKHWLEQ